MSEKRSEEKVTETPEAAETEKKETCCNTGSMCRPHTSLYLSIIAVVLAAYAAFGAGKAPTTDTEARLNGLESSVQSLNDQITALGKDVEENRDNLIKNQLKKALLNIQEISGLAKDEAKAAIAEAEKILSGLTAPAVKPAPAAVAPEAAPVEETAPVAEPAAATPAEEAAPAATEESAPATDSASEPEAAVADETPAIEVPTEETPAAPETPQAF